MITFGRFLAFMRLWVECIVVRPATIAIVALTFSIYAVKPFFPECDPPDSAVRLLAAVCIGERHHLLFESFPSTLLSLCNTAELPFHRNPFICELLRGEVGDFHPRHLHLRQAACLVHHHRDGDRAAWTWKDWELHLGRYWDRYHKDCPLLLFRWTFQLLSLFFQHFLPGLFAYNGWNYLNFVIEEMKDPVRDLPRAIMISCVTVTIVYVTTNIAFYTTLNVPEVLGSEAVAVVSTFHSWSVTRNMNCHFADLCWEAVRPICLPHPCGCGSLHLWRGQWHSSHFFQVIVVFKQQIYAMIEFRGMRGKNPPQCFLKNSLISSHRLFYAGACEKQMPEVLSMIQVNMKFSIQLQNLHTVDITINMIASMSSWKSPKRDISRWPRWPLHHRLQLWWASSHPCQFYLSSKKTSILILFPKNLHFCIAGIHVLLLPLLFQHIFHDQLRRLCNMGRCWSNISSNPEEKAFFLISVHTYTLSFPIQSWWEDF